MTENGVDGNLMLIIGCRNLEREGERERQRERETERETGRERQRERKNLEIMHLGTKKRIQTGFCTWDNTRFRRLAAISQTHYSWS